jgi:Large polyvalent protein associated domain 22
MTQPDPLIDYSGLAQLRASLDADPDKAGRAMQLQQASGLPAQAIYNDPEEFEKIIRDRMTNHLISQNSHLQDYINSHPMAAAVSHDDWGQLDKASQAITKLNASASKSWIDHTADNLAAGTASGLNEIVGSLFYVFGGGAKGLNYQRYLEHGYRFKLSPEFQPSKEESETLSGQVLQGLGSMVPMLAAASVGGVAGAAAVGGLSGGGREIESAREAGAEPNVAEFAAGATLGAVGAALPLHWAMGPVGQLGKGTIGWSLSKLFQATRGAALFTAAGEAQEWSHSLLANMFYDPQAHYQPDLGRMITSAIVGGVVGTGFGKVKPWVDAGKPIPPGVEPTIDKIATQQAHLDIKDLDAALSELSTSSTRERSTELAQAFARQHSSLSVFVSADGVRRLYGDKEPSPEDGILGWVPDLVSKLGSAEASGGHVEIPLADWLAKVEKEVAAELRDDTKIRPNGVTINEGKALVEANAIRASREEEKERGLYTPEEQKAFELNEQLIEKYGSLSDAFNKWTPEEQAEFDKVHAAAVSNIIRPPKLSALQQGRGDNFDTPFAVYDRNGNLVERNIENENHAAELAKEHGGSYKFDPLYDIDKVPDKAPAAANENAVDNIRRSAGLDQTYANLRATFQQLVRPRVDLGGGFWGTSVPTELMDQHEAEIVARVSKVINELAPGVEAIFVRDLADRLGEVRGIYSPRTADHAPFIAVSLDYEHPEETAMHEVIHHLRQGYFTVTEWRKLSLHAIKAGWIRKYRIKERYPEGEGWLHVEEAIAHAFPEWARGEIVVPEPVQRSFEKLRDLLDRMKVKIQDLLGWKVSVEDLFTKAARGEIGRRTPRAKPKPGFETEYGGFGPIERAVPGEGDVRAARADEPGGELAPSKPAWAEGIPLQRFQRWQRLEAQKQSEDLEFAQQQAEKAAKRKLTKAWKDEAQYIRTDAHRDVMARPDVAAAEFFHNKSVYGSEVSTKPSLDRSALSEDQVTSLPKSLVTDNGLNPDQVAGLFGYKSGDALVANLALHEHDRAQSGLSHKDYVGKLIDEEVDRRMEAKHGNLAENILEEARNHVISQTQINILHHEVEFLGKAAGVKNIWEDKDGRPVTKKQLQDWVKSSFDNLTMKKDAAWRFLQDAGNAWRQVGPDSSPKEMFDARKKQTLSVMMAKEAKAVEVMQRKFDTLSKAYRGRERAGVQQEYTNFIRQTLQRVGMPIRDVGGDLAKTIAESDYENITDFMRGKIDDGLPMDIADILLDPNFKKPFDELTNGEFKAVHTSISIMDKIGRAEKKQIASGVAADTDVVLDKMNDLLQRFGVVKYRFRPDSMVVRAFKNFAVSSVRTELLLDRWDDWNPRGPFNQYVGRPMFEAANYHAALQRRYMKQLGAIGDIKNPLKVVAQSPIINPRTGEPIPLTNRDMMGIVHNWGNESNIDKFLRGWRIVEKGDDPPTRQAKRDAFESWLHANTTPEMWNRAQKIGNIFGKAFKELSMVYRRITGIAPEAVELEKFTNPHGTFDGWYHPMVYSHEFRTQSLGGVSARGLLSPDFRNTMPSNPHAHARTGYAAPVELNSDTIPVRLNQMLHDIAFREAVLDVHKIFKNAKFQDMISNHYGSRYRDELNTWLQDVVNGSNINEQASAEGERLSTYLRQNAVHTYVGYGMSTVMKHGPTALAFSAKEVGPINFARELLSYTVKDPRSGERNWSLSNNSEEIQRRERNWEETLSGVSKKLTGKQTLRETVMKYGAKPVALSDLLSAKATWNAAYKEAIRVDPDDEGMAYYAADKAVRHAHGSTAITNLARVARSKGIGAWMTTLYGFFGTRLQGIIETGMKANDVYKLGKAGELTKAAVKMPEVAAGYVTYVVIPTLIEAAVRGTQITAFGALLGGIATSVIYARDVYHSLEEGGDISLGLLASAVRDTLRPVRGIIAGKYFNKQNTGQIVEDAATISGLFSGVVPKPVGKAAKYLTDIQTGKERAPQGLGDLATGLYHGTTKQRRQK